MPGSQTYSNQPSNQPPPLVSLAKHNISMCHSPSASVIYAPLVSSVPSTPAEQDIFWLHFVKGNISRCNGCGKRDLRDVNGKPKLPPHDLCVRHKEYVIFENPHTGKHQLSQDLRNVYYHASMMCVAQKNCSFNPTNQLKVSGEVKSKLNAIHLSHLLNEFGLSFLNK